MNAKCKITEIISLDKSKINNPILAHFQNGQMPSKLADESDGCIAIDTENKNKSMAIIATKDTIYSGQVNKGFPSDLQRTFIGIRNKTTNKVRLIEVNQCSMLSFHYDHVNINRKSTQRNSDENLKLLYKEFGGKKANREFERQQRMKLNVDVVKDQLNQTIGEVINRSLQINDADDKFEKSKLDQELYLQEIAPKININATTLKDIYQLSDLIDQILLDRLNEEALAILETSVEKLPFNAKLLVNAVVKIQSTSKLDSEENLNKIKICIYTDALINFLKALNQNRNMQKINFSDITEKVETDIRKKFRQSDGVKIIKTNYIIHKLTCYIIILLLLISPNYETEIGEIVEMIHTSRTKLMSFLKVIPVRMKSGSKMLTLKLPSSLVKRKTL